jgi:hypothetical protein
MKKIKNNRKKQRDTIAQRLRERKQVLLGNLSRIAEGKTPPEIVDAHIEYFETCDNGDKLLLQEIFLEQEDKMQTDICLFFAEKQNANS